MKPLDYQRLIWAEATDLTTNQRAILALLAFKALTCADRYGWIAVSQWEIADRCSMSRDTVQRNLPLLIRAGWIAASKQIRNGRHAATKYRLRDPHRAAQSGTESGTESGNHHAAQSGTESGDGHKGQSVNVVDKGIRDGAPHSDDGSNPKPTPADTTALLDELGIRRRHRPRRHA